MQITAYKSTNPNTTPGSTSQIWTTKIRYAIEYYDEMARKHHLFNGHEFEKTPGDSEGQGSKACCSPWAHKELDMT